MGRLSVFFTALFFLQVSSSVADQCVSHAGVTPLECYAASAGSGGSGQVASGTGGTSGSTGGGVSGAGGGSAGGAIDDHEDISACATVGYSGSDPVKYRFTGQGPFQITITDLSIPEGGNIIIGNFMCDSGDGVEECFKFALDSSVTAPLTFFKDNNPVLVIHGQGSLIFRTDDGVCSRKCNEYYAFQGVKLRVFNFPSKMWDNAKEACEDEGGYLAVINSPEMAQAVNDVKANQSLSNTFTWFGLRHLIGGNFQWCDGTTLTINTGTGMPLDGTFTKWVNVPESYDGVDDESCMVNVYTLDNAWEDHGCDAAFPYICQCPS